MEDAGIKTTTSPEIRCRITLRKESVDLESGIRVTSDVGATSCMSILVFLGLSVLELFSMYATDRRRGWYL